MSADETYYCIVYNTRLDLALFLKKRAKMIFLEKRSQKRLQLFDVLYRRSHEKVLRSWQTRHPQLHHLQRYPA
jgi:hypothetical protein